MIRLEGGHAIPHNRNGPHSVILTPLLQYFISMHHGQLICVQHTCKQEVVTCGWVLVMHVNLICHKVPVITQQITNSHWL